MNKQRLLQLATIIETLEHATKAEDHGPSPLSTFNMGVWKCGTAGCIGGWAEAIWGNPEPKNDGCEIERGRDLLRLNSRTAYRLFYPQAEDGYSVEAIGGYEAITPAQAAATIRKLVRSGQIDWRALEKAEAATTRIVETMQAVQKIKAAATADEVVERLEKAGWKVEELA